MRLNEEISNVLWNAFEQILPPTSFCPYDAPRRSRHEDVLHQGPGALLDASRHIRTHLVPDAELFAHLAVVELGACLAAVALDHLRIKFRAGEARRQQYQNEKENELFHSISNDL